MKCFCRRIAYLSTIHGLLTVAFVALSQMASAEPVCRPLALTQYCFGNGDLKILVPRKKFDAELEQRSADLLAERGGVSTLSDARKADISLQWQQSVQEAYRFAEQRFPDISILNEPGILDIQGSTPNAFVARLASFGPVFRLVFDGPDTGPFLLSGPPEINIKRLLQGIELVMEEGGYIERFMATKLRIAAQKVENGGEYVPIIDFAQALLGKVGVARFLKNSKAQNVDWHGIFGAELLFGSYIAYDTYSRDRNKSLNHSVHFFSEATSWGDYIESPQVTHMGTLMLPDEIAKQFSDQELSMLLKHEAMHLARPNFFDVASFSSGIIKENFSQIDLARMTSFLSSVLGHKTEIERPLTCLLKLTTDDELFADFHVLSQLKDSQTDMIAYRDWLQLLNERYEKGPFPPTYYRLELADKVIEEFQKQDQSTLNPWLQDEKLQAAIAEFFKKRIWRFYISKTLTMSDLLDEMAREPDLRFTALSLKTVIKYYMSRSDFDETLGTPGPGGVTCAQMWKLFRISGD